MIILDICVGSNVVIKLFVYFVLLLYKLMNIDLVDGLVDGVLDVGFFCVFCEIIVKFLWNGYIVDYVLSCGK